MNEAIDSAVNNDELEEEADEEVAKVLMEILDRSFSSSNSLTESNVRLCL